MAVVGILLRIGITELIVRVFIDLSVLVLVRYLGPALSFLVEGIGLHGLASIDLKNDRSIIVNICCKPISVFQSKQSVHQTYIGIDVRYGESFGINFKYSCKSVYHQSLYDY